MKAVVSACYSEIEFLIESLNVTKIKDNVWATENEVIAFLGIGYFNAAIELEKILNTFQNITDVLFTGTAGYYSEKESNLFLKSACVSETKLLDIGVLLNFSKTALLDTDETYRSTFQINELPLLSVITSQSITIDNKLSSKIYDSERSELENMELFGIAKVCSDRHKQWGAIIGITNKVGHEGSDQWMLHHKKVEYQNCNLILKKVISNG